MRALEHVANRARQAERHMPQNRCEQRHDFLRRWIRSHPGDRLLKTLSRIAESVQHDVSESAAGELGDRAEGSRRQHYVTNEGQRWKFLDDAGHCIDVDYAVGSGIDYGDADGLPADDVFELFPRGGNVEIRLVHEDVANVGQKLRREKDRYAQMVALGMRTQCARVDRKARYRML